MFAHAYVLNLDADSDRMRKISARLQRLGVEYERFAAISPNSISYLPQIGRLTSAEYACAMSHAAVLRSIEEHGYETALIIEDDAVFRDDTPKIMANIRDETARQCWDMFYMGLHLRKSLGRLSCHLGQVGTGYHAHAYAVSRRAVPRLIRSICSILENPVCTFDEFSDPTLNKIYTVPILAVQEPNQSYTYNVYTDRLPQYFAMFDGEEFEANCLEIRGMESDWRAVIQFKSQFFEAQRALQCGSIDRAAQGFRQAIAGWPRLARLLSSDANASDMIGPLKDEGSCGLDVVTACTWLTHNIRRIAVGSF